MNAETKVYAYLRVSTLNQDVSNQKHGIMLLAEAKGWHDVEYIEDYVSGTVEANDRKLGSLVKVMKPGDILVVSELSRLGRSMQDIMKFVQEAIGLKIRIYAAKGGWEISGSDISAKIMTMVFCMVAEIERDLIVMRTKEGLARRKSEGIRLGNPNMMRKSKLSQHGAVIKERVLQGDSIYSIAKDYDTSWTAMKHFIKTRINA